MDFSSMILKKSIFAKIFKAFIIKAHLYFHIIFFCPPIISSSLAFSNYLLMVSVQMLSGASSRLKVLKR